jgi:hypothetical protein
VVAADWRLTVVMADWKLASGARLDLANRQPSIVNSILDRQSNPQSSIRQSAIDNRRFVNLQSSIFSLQLAG